MAGASQEFRVLKALVWVAGDQGGVVGAYSMYFKTKEGFNKWREANPDLRQGGSEAIMEQAWFDAILLNDGKAFRIFDKGSKTNDIKYLHE